MTMTRSLTAFAAGLLASALLVLLAGCGGGGSEPDQPPDCATVSDIPTVGGGLIRGTVLHTFAVARGESVRLEGFATYEAANLVGAYEESLRLALFIDGAPVDSVELLRETVQGVGATFQWRGPVTWTAAAAPATGLAELRAYRGTSHADVRICTTASLVTP